MIANWRDHRPITVACGLCGAGVQTTAQLRGRIYCLECREKRRKESAQAANERFRKMQRFAQLRSTL